MHDRKFIRKEIYQQRFGVLYLYTPHSLKLWLEKKIDFLPNLKQRMTYLQANIFFTGYRLCICAGFAIYCCARHCTQFRWRLLASLHFTSHLGSLLFFSGFATNLMVVFTMSRLSCVTCHHYPILTSSTYLHESIKDGGAADTTLSRSS